MRVELNEEDDGKKTSIALKLWVEDPKKLKGKYKDTGAIEFTFDLVHEVPEVVAQEMVKNTKFISTYVFLTYILSIVSIFCEYKQKMNQLFCSASPCFFVAGRCLLKFMKIQMNLIYKHHKNTSTGTLFRSNFLYFV